MQLYFLLLGCKPTGRNTEQHDTFFGIGNSLHDLLPQIADFWPDGGRIHIDSWRMITQVDRFAIKVVPKAETAPSVNKLFFLNLGGYKPGDMEEYHYKMFVVAPDKATAVAAAKQSAFYKHTGFKGADSHIDDKYGVDVDDIYEIDEVLPEALKQQYALSITPVTEIKEDELHIGYTKLSSLSAQADSIIIE